MKVALALYTAAALAAAVVVGNMSYTDEVLAEKVYCEGLRMGDHPAYKPEVDCGMVVADSGDG